MTSSSQLDVGIKHSITPLVTNGYLRSPTDECIYVKTVRKGDGFISFVILAVCVDDIIPVPNDVKMLKAEKESLCKEFEMVDLGEIHFILGMSIKRDRATRTLTISQGQCLKDLLKQFGMEECKPMSTPLESRKKFTSEQKKKNDVTKASTNKLWGASPMFQLLQDQTLLWLL